MISRSTQTSGVSINNNNFEFLILTDFQLKSLLALLIAVRFVLWDINSSEQVPGIVF